MNWRSAAAAGVAVGAGVLIGAWSQGTAVGQDAPPEPPPDDRFSSISFEFERMIGGVAVESGDVPWMMQLRSDGTYQCGAAYIAPSFATGGNLIDGWRSDRTLAPQYALTAAHCVVGTTGNFTVASGTLSLNGDRDGEVQPVIKVIAPQNDDRTGTFARSGATLVNDIAILVLGPPITERPTLPAVRRSISLATTNDVDVVDLAAVQTSGWGQAGTRMSDTLLEVLLPLVPHAICASTYGTAFDMTDTLCAGFSTGEYAHCNGDSGGPLYYRPASWRQGRSLGEPLLVGVVSQRQQQCGDAGFYGVFESVARHEAWIRCELQPYADLRARLWPSELNRENLQLATQNGQIDRTRAC